MGYSAALAIDHAGSECFVCREQPASPYEHKPPRPHVAPPAGTPPAGTRPASPRPVIVTTPVVEREVRVADGMALALRAALDCIAVPLARSAAAFVRRQGWCEFGFARLDDHARERFGRCGRWLRDLALLGESLDRLPGLQTALTGEDGGRPLGRVAAMVVARIADPESLQDWIGRARRLTVRELRVEVTRARALATGPPEGAGMTETGSAAPRAPAEPAAMPPPDDLESVDRVLVRMAVPAPVRAAFDEGLDLFRAVEGREATATSFVEALVGESLAGPHSFENSAAAGEGFVAADGILPAAATTAMIEDALARSTERWRHLPVPGRGAGEEVTASGAAARALGYLSRLSAVPGSGDAVDLDRRIRALIALEDELETALGRLLADMAERGAWGRLRFAGVGHYAEERLGLSRTAGEDRARAARALRRFRLLRRAYDSGRVGLEAVLIVARILGDGATGPASEQAWVERAGEASVKRLRDEARALGLRRCAGSVATAPRARGTLADPAPLSDADWHASLRRVRGTTAERIARLGRAALGQGALPPDAPLPAAPDPSTCLPCSPDVFLRLRLPAPLAADFAGAIDARRGALEMLSGSIPWDEPWPDPDAAPSLRAARTFSIRCRRVPSWVGLLALLEDFAATWDARDGAPVRPQDLVFIRDGWRCTAPGCTSRRNLEDHHLLYRSRGGGDEPSNRAAAAVRGDDIATASSGDSVVMASAGAF